uniref:Uncharacterized protein n=1 Tax=Anguilla anguilla TaxID=7936 RepID=A0A0E9RC82_ANGAN
MYRNHMCTHTQPWVKIRCKELESKIYFSKKKKVNVNCPHNFIKGPC